MANQHGSAPLKPEPSRLDRIWGITILLVFCTWGLIIGGRLFVPPVVTAAVVAITLADIATLTWYHLLRSRHLMLRAIADIVGSVIAGSGLLIFITALANSIALAGSVGDGLRDWLARASELLAGYWWAWALLYVVLAGFSLGSRLRVRGVADMAEQLERWRIVPTLTAGRRVVAAAHYVLLVTTLIVATGPGQTASVMASAQRTQYGVVLQSRMVAQSQALAYGEIRAAFTDPRIIRAQQPTLQALFAAIHRTSANDSDEQDLANVIGRLQGDAIAGDPPQIPSPDELAAKQPAFEGSVKSLADLHTRDAGLSEQERESEHQREALRTAIDLAVGALAIVIAGPGPPDVVLAVVRDYLGGLLEASRLRDLLFERVERDWFSEAPVGVPSATEGVVPNPDNLKATARSAVDAATQGYAVSSDDQGLIAAADRDTALSGAVEYAHEALSIRQRQTSAVHGVNGHGGAGHPVPVDPIEPPRPVRR